MPLTLGQRRKLAQDFAHLIGGTDAEGREHKLAPSEPERQLKRAKELFAVLDTDKENMMWEFVDGRKVGEFINAGRYKVEYLGKNRDHLANEKVRKKMLEQVKQSVQGLRAGHEKAGVFETEQYYDNLLKTRTEEVKKRFKEYDDSKETKE